MYMFSPFIFWEIFLSFPKTFAHGPLEDFCFIDKNWLTCLSLAARKAEKVSTTCQGQSISGIHVKPSYILQHTRSSRVWEHSLSRALMLFWENNEFIVWRAFVGVCLNVLVVVSGQDIWVGNSIWKHSVDGTQSYGDAKIAQWELIKHKKRWNAGPGEKLLSGAFKGNWSPKVDWEQLAEEGIVLMGHGRSFRRREWSAEWKVPEKPRLRCQRCPLGFGS